MNGVKVAERDLNLVFQNYALFPHMNVGDNVSFGLRMARRNDIVGRVREVLERVRLRGLRTARAADALWRRAAACGPRPRHRHGPASAAARRAPGRSRPQAAQGTARGAAPAPARARHDLRLRHPRPGGSPLHVRPGGGDERRPHRAGRHAAGDLRAARDALRGRVRRARPTSSRKRAGP